MIGQLADEALPRYFAVQKDTDVIILDLDGDKYYWKGDVIAETLSTGTESDREERIVMLNLQLPRKEGSPPRGRHRYWRFDVGLVARALLFLGSSKRMVSKGFSGFVDRLNKDLARPVRNSTREISLAEISTAMEWARLLFPFEAKCLPIAIATARLARRYGIEARVVVGVQALPLRAHAWAQVGDDLINDFLDRVQLYRPLFSLPYRGSTPS